MSAPPSDIVRQLLLDDSLAGDVGESWPVYVGSLPDQPDNAIAVFDTAGTQEGRIMASGEKIIHPGIMVVVRNQDYIAGMSKTVAIARALDGVRGRFVQTVVDGNTEDWKILNISRQGDVNPLGIGDDDRQRYHFSVNAITTIKERT